MPLLSAYIMPHPPLAVEAVGKGGERGIPGTMAGYESISRHMASLKPDTIIIISPHAPLYADFIHISPGKSARGDFGRFDAKEAVVTVNYDQELVTAVEELAAETGLNAGTLGADGDKALLDHGVMVPLWFVNKYYHDYKVVRVSQSELSVCDNYRLGTLVREAIDRLGRRAVVIASGDLSHILKAHGQKGAVGRAYDEKITGIMKSGRLEEFLAIDEGERAAAAECGVGSFIIMTGILHKTAVEPEFLSYEGTYGVGYAQCIFHIKDPMNGPDYLALYKAQNDARIRDTRQKEGFLPGLARVTVESYVQTGRLPEKPSELPAFANNRAGVFVSIKKEGSLRGCIGTMAPTTASVTDEVRQNAVSACSRDFRFDPVTVEELPLLTYSVDVLSEPEPVPAGQAAELLDPSRYGVIVSAGARRGVLLPDLEGVDTVEQQLSIALQKAGIKGDNFNVERFTVTRYK